MKNCVGEEMQTFYTSLVNEHITTIEYIFTISNEVLCNRHWISKQNDLRCHRRPAIQQYFLLIKVLQSIGMKSFTSIDNCQGRLRCQIKCNCQGRLRCQIKCHFHKANFKSTIGWWAATEIFIYFKERLCEQTTFKVSYLKVTEAKPLFNIDLFFWIFFAILEDIIRKRLSFFKSSFSITNE